MLILRPQLSDVKIILYYAGLVTLGIGAAMLLPLALAIVLREWNPALNFVIGANIAIIIGLLLTTLGFTEKEMHWLHGLIIVPTVWLLAMFLGAIPLYLSGHFASYLDAAFETMSGFATTGLSLIQNLDHLSYATNFWRHLIMFLGGQGIVVIVLTALVSRTAGIYRMYLGEAREEKILPNVVETARFIWLVSLIYLILGVSALSTIAWLEGIPLLKAFFHGSTVFMAAFDTGGFTPQSQSIIYYHSVLFEVATIFFMVAGGINFSLHFALFTGNRREVYRNAETISFFITVSLAATLVAFGLAKLAAYPDIISLFRRGFYQVISAHTGTGFMTIYPAQFNNAWGTIALTSIILPMALGAAAGSTAGGIKALRLVIISKAFCLEFRRLISPPAAVLVEKFHHIKEVVLSEQLVHNAFLITFAYLLTYFGGALVGLFYGYPLNRALFESVSAAANVGLTTGVTSVDMPAFLKIVYIFEMWIGRLEFASIVALGGFLAALIRGK